MMARLFLALLMLMVRALQLGSAANQCGNSSSYCPSGMACCAAKYSPSTYGCEVPIGNLSRVSAGCGDGLPEGDKLCCKMGPAEPPSSTLANVLIIGDSVSIGYATGVSANLARRLSDVAKVQHGPWDVSDGGAGDTASGVACLDRWLVTQAQQEVKWDLITFNFGLHDLTNTSHCEGLYKQQMANITHRLAALGTKVLFITTTPFMPLRTRGNTVVEDMNAIARQLVADYNIPVVDLYSTVTDICGPVYTSCAICRKDPCSYHYNGEGMSKQAAVVEAAIRQHLKPLYVGLVAV